MASIFSRIVAGEIPSYKVAETDKFYAFLDINPVAKGHVLVIPKREEDYFFDLTDEELGGIMSFAKRVAKAIKAAFPCNRVGVSVIGIDVPHAHIHLVPLNTGAEINMSNPKLKLEASEFQEIAAKIAANFK
ncbi:MAG: HIT family protein [Bacteroidales bacterium]|nr:HIT family protein [Bacteroidales bacterium]